MKPASKAEKVRQYLRVEELFPKRRVSSMKPNIGLRQKAMLGRALKKVKEETSRWKVSL